MIPRQSIDHRSCPACHMNYGQNFLQTSCKSNCDFDSSSMTFPKTVAKIKSNNKYMFANTKQQQILQICANAMQSTVRLYLMCLHPY